MRDMPDRSKGLEYWGNMLGFASSVVGASRVSFSEGDGYCVGELKLTTKAMSEV